MPIPQIKPLENLNFSELVNVASQNILLSLIEEGGKGFKSAIHLWLSQAILWNKEKEK